MIIKAEDERIVKIEPRHNGWIRIEVLYIDKEGKWQSKAITLMAGELLQIVAELQKKT